MDKYFKNIEIRWADVDASRHMRHSAYYDYATFARFGFFTDLEVDVNQLAEWGVNPVILREEALFYREIKMHEKVQVGVALAKMTNDYTQFSFEQIFLKANSKKAAKLTVEGGWLNLNTRKLTTPPKALMTVIDQIPKTKDFASFERLNFYK